jgi:hypothetical protein
MWGICRGLLQPNYGETLLQFDRHLTSTLSHNFRLEINVGVRSHYLLGSEVRYAFGIKLSPKGTRFANAYRISLFDYFKSDRII